MSRRNFYLVAVLVLALFQAALAGTSLSTGTILPGWDQVRSGGLHDSASRLLRSYSVQAGVTCGLIDVHVKDNARLYSRSVHVDTWFSSSYYLHDLLSDRDQHVILLEPRYGRGEHLLLVVEAERSLVLAAC